MHSNEIHLIHRRINAKRDLIENNSITSYSWKTCLREIIFLDNWQHFTLEQKIGFDILSGKEALSFLIEILCGLHSPVLGETEVLGQFKNFVQNQQNLKNSYFSHHQKWLHFVLTEVKRIRSTYCIGEGSNSYGSLIRKHTTHTKNISILGTGHLSQEIIPWMISDKNIQVIGRNPSIHKIRALVKNSELIDFSTYDSITNLNEVIVIAAPLSDEIIIDLIMTQSNDHLLIFDLRGEQNKLPEKLIKLNKTNGSIHRLITLNSMFLELSKHKEKSENVISIVKNEILSTVKKFTYRLELRPMGWDDLCA